jgi:hypothetical protein
VPPRGGGKGGPASDHGSGRPALTKERQARAHGFRIGEGCQTVFDFNSI